MSFKCVQFVFLHFIPVNFRYRNQNKIDMVELQNERSLILKSIALALQGNSLQKTLINCVRNCFFFFSYYLCCVCVCGWSGEHSFNCIFTFEYLYKLLLKKLLYSISINDICYTNGKFQIEKTFRMLLS